MLYYSSNERRMTMDKNKIKTMFILSICSILFFIGASFIMTLEPAAQFKIDIKIVYLIVTVISFLFLIWYIGLENKKIVFCLLFTAVFVVNLGYFFLSASSVLSEALMANRISYLGAVFLPLFMLLIVVDVTNIKFHRFIVFALICISMVVFMIAASAGFSTIYYKEVELVFVDGGAKLLKTYGPLHKIYYLYLFSYYFLMIGVVIHGWIKDRKKNLQLSFHLLTIVFCNILVWYLNQLFKFDFEFLSISYILTEFYLLSIYNVLNGETSEVSHDEVIANADLDRNYIIFDEDNLPDLKSINKVWPQVSLLTSREVEVFNRLVMDRRRKEIAEELCVSENTVKKHVSNIFSKLDVSSKSELVKMVAKVYHEE